MIGLKRQVPKKLGNIPVPVDRHDASVVPEDETRTPSPEPVSLSTEFIPKTGHVSDRMPAPSKRRAVSPARIGSLLIKALILALMLLVAGSLTALYEQGTYYGDRALKKIEGTSINPIKEIKSELRTLAEDMHLAEPKPKPAPIVENKTPPPVEKSPPPKETPPPAPSGDGYTVQVAATREAAKAEQAVEKVKALGFDAYSAKAEHKGRSLYRIRVGQNLSLAQAQTLRQELKSKGHKDLFITKMNK